MKRSMAWRLFEKVLINALDVKDFLIAATDVVPHHQPAKLLGINQYDSRAYLAGSFYRAP